MKKILAALLAASLMLTLCSCGGGDLISAPSQINGRTIGAIKNSASATLAGEVGTVRTYETAEELAAAVRGGSVDCALSDGELASSVLNSQRGIKKLKTPYIEQDWCIAVAKENIDLTSDINAALAELDDNDVLESIEKFYLNGKGERYVPAEQDDDIASIKLCVDPSFYPYSYKEDGEWMGIDVDIARAICDILGVGLEIVSVSHDKLIDTVWRGEAEFAMGAISETADTLEKLDLSDSYFSGTQVVIVRK